MKEIKEYNIINLLIMQENLKKQKNGNIIIIIQPTLCI